VGSFHFRRESLRISINSPRLALPTRPVVVGLELLRAVLLDLETTDVSCNTLSRGHRSARAMRPGRSFLFAHFVVAAARRA
jgi:hypothetical protein